MSAWIVESRRRASICAYPTPAGFRIELDTAGKGRRAIHLTPDQAKQLSNQLLKEQDE